MFLTILIVSLEESFIRPELLPKAMLLVQVPLAFVLGSVHVQVEALTMGFAVLPLTFVNVTVCMDQAPLAIVTVLVIRSFVFRAVVPDLHAVALP